jgi:predicted  nucleic acid-binding Zn-ribbon protein
MDMLETLLGIEQELTTWIFSATPETEEDQQAMTKVQQLRDTLNQTVNQIVLRRVELAATNLAQASQLTALSARLEKTTKTIESANEVIATVSSVLGVASSLVSQLV